MKKQILLVLGLFFTVLLQAGSNQTNLTVVSTAGDLATAIITAGGSLSTVTNLTVTGTMDARDFVTIKNMPVLAEINLSGTSVSAYLTNPENTVPDNALKYCTSLTTINLPSAITKIGRMAFYGLWRIKTITIPSNVTFIGDQAFRGCEEMTAVDLPSELITLDYSAFEECYALLSITIPSKVTTIGYGAFNKCYALKSVILPSALSSIDGGVFQGCRSLETINFPSTLTSLGYQAFAGSGLKNIILPPSLLSIGEGTFRECGSLQSVSIPASVTSIGSSAFYFCSGLTSLYAYASTPVNLKTSTTVFDYLNTTTCILHVPNGTLSDYQAANQWSAFSHIVDDILATGIIHATSMHLSLYPNPATDKFTIRGVEKTTSVCIFDLSGSFVLKQTISGTSYINISSLEKGIYVVKANGLVGKLVKN